MRAKKNLPSRSGPSVRGVLNIDKPSGITSYDVIRHIKRLLPKESKIGHAGTLDPLAQGVLIVLVGSATKIADYLQAQDKEYEVLMRLGISTDTDDITGKIRETRLVPKLSRKEVEDVLTRFVGPQAQIPPAYSALKIAGARAYRLSRSGVMPTLKARNIEVHELELLRLGSQDGYQTIALRTCVTKGTYIRALVRDIGNALGCGATVAALTRTRSGRFTRNQAIALDSLSAANLKSALVSIPDALSFMPVVTISSDALRRMRHGMNLGWAECNLHEDPTLSERGGADASGKERESSELLLRDAQETTMALARIQERVVRIVRLLYDDQA